MSWSQPYRHPAALPLQNQGRGGTSRPCGDLQIAETLGHLVTKDSRTWKLPGSSYVYFGKLPLNSISENDLWLRNSVT